jgi:NAD(P)-dependent dehydrogenase (short-subunit alcohol dehydrogenase family)
MEHIKVWFITGCSSGFGEAVTLNVLGRGDQDIATARRAGKFDKLKEAGAHTMSMDVLAPGGTEKDCPRGTRRLRESDYLINNAGYSQIGGLEELTSDFLSLFLRFGAAWSAISLLPACCVTDGAWRRPEETQAQFATNVFGLLNVTRSNLLHASETIWDDCEHFQPRGVAGSHCRQTVLGLQIGRQRLLRDVVP